LFARLDDLRRYPLIWISAPPGAGKTTLVASYLAARSLHDIWYQVDRGDEDVATFFSYLGQAAQKSRPRRDPLPLFTAEYAFGLEGFSRNFFEQLCARLPEGALLVFDNYHEAPTDSRLHEVIRAGLDRVPHGHNIVVISRHAPPQALARQYANGHVAANVLDGDPETFWHTRWQDRVDPMPHEIVIDLGKAVTLTGLVTWPRQDQANGRIARCDIHVSDDPRSWGPPAARAKWPNTEEKQTVQFGKPVKGRYVKLVARAEVHGNAFAAVAELDVLTDEK
jgi:hypothetical protein